MSGNLTLGTDKITLDATSGTAEAIRLNAGNSLVNAPAITATNSGTVDPALYARNATVGVHPCIIASDNSGLPKATVNNDGSATFQGNVSVGGITFDDNTTINTVPVTKLRAGPNIQLSPDTGVGEVQISAIKDSDDTFWELVGDDLHPKGDDIDVSVGDGNIVLDHSGNATFDGNVGIGTKIDLEGSTGSITAKGTTNNVRVSLIGEGLSIGAQINAYNDYGSFFHGISGDTSGDYIYYTAEEKNHLFYTQGLPRVVINSSGNVFIGGTTLQSHPNMDDLQIGDGSGNRGITISSGADSFGSLAFGCSTDTSGNDRYVGMVEYYHVDDSMRFYANISERMRITSNGTIQLPNGSPGIQFGSIPSPQPDSRTITGTTLDDYEEGGWTPGIAENGLGGVQWDTITAVSGSYIRVGKMVTVMFRIDYSGLPTNINLAFYGYITGLPFAGATADENMHAQNIAMIGPSESNILYHSAWANQANSLSVFKSQNNLPPGPMRSENFPDQATQIRGCFTYLTP